jgi:hypothetical protein
MHEVKLCTRSLPPKEVALLLSLVKDDPMVSLPLASLEELTLPSSSNGRSSSNRSRSTFKDQLKQTNNHNLLAGNTHASAEQPL